MKPSRFTVLRPGLMLVALFAMAGCGGAGSPEFEPGGQGATPQQEAGSSIPFPDDSAAPLKPAPVQREVSGQTIYHSFPLDAPMAVSDAVIPDANEVQIYAGGGDLQYAVYRIPYAGASMLDIVFTLSTAGDDCWLALADYSRAAWDFQRLEQLENSAVDINDVRWHSPKGHVYFALIAANDSQINLDSFKSKLHYGDTITHEVAQIGAHEAISMLTLDGRPGIFYVDEADYSLRFCHAVTARPSIASDWHTSKVQAEGSPGQMQSAAVWQDKALIVYTKQQSGELWLSWSTNHAPAAESDWQHVQLLGDELMNQHVSLEIINGQPALALFRGDPLDADQDGFFGYIHYLSHSGDDLASGWGGYWLSTSGFFSSEPSLAEVAGRPSIAFVNSSSGKIMYASAKVANPQSPSDWNIRPTEISAFAGRLRLTDAGGYPAMLFPRTDGFVGYLCGLTEEPLQGADWLEWNSHCNLFGNGNTFDLLSIDGRPQLLITGRVEFPDGQGGTDHNQFPRLYRPFQPQMNPLVSAHITMEFAYGREIGFGYCGTVLEEQPAVAYVDAETGKLMFGRLIF